MHLKFSLSPPNIERLSHEAGVGQTAALATLPLVCLEFCISDRPVCK